MTYLVRTEEDKYKLFYSKPAYRYVVSPLTGSWFSVGDYLDLLHSERNQNTYDIMEDYDIFEGPADVSENNLGLPIDTIVAEYLLQGFELLVGEHVELEISND